MAWDFNKFIGELEFLGNLFNNRMNKLESEVNISSLIRPLNVEKAKESALNFFGEGEFRALGIDGSMDNRDRLEVVILYISISGFSCSFKVDNDGEITVNLDDIKRDDKYIASAIIPIWFEDLNELMRQDIGLNRSLNRIIEGIPFSLMTFGEFYMGYKAVSEDDKVKVVLYDRPFASSIHPFQRDLRRLIFRDGGGFFTSFSYGGIRLNRSELLLGLYLGPDLYDIPFRGAYKIYSIIQYIVRNGGIVKLSELEKEFNTDRDKIIKRISKLDRKYLDKTLIDEITSNEIILNSNILNYWSKIRRMINIVGHNIFKNPGGKHPLYFEEDDSWIGTKEINALTLFTMYETVKESINKKKMIIGIGKDTYVTDITRSIIPFSNYLGITDIRNLPIKSDKPLLTILSSTHQDDFKTPWRFIVYDGAFATLIKNESTSPPLKAARKTVFQEGLIARSYFQLRTFKTARDTIVRSPVFFYDRFIIKDDNSLKIDLKVLEEGKEVSLKPLFEEGFSDYDNLILYILSKMDKTEIAEATGHNYLLFLADKDAKASINMIRETVVQAADSKISEIISRRHIYVITRRFRDFRYLVEKRRRRW